MELFPVLYMKTGSDMMPGAVAAILLPLGKLTKIAIRQVRAARQSTEDLVLTDSFYLSTSDSLSEEERPNHRGKPPSGVPKVYTRAALFPHLHGQTHPMHSVSKAVKVSTVPSPTQAP